MPSLDDAYLLRLARRNFNNLRPLDVTKDESVELQSKPHVADQDAMMLAMGNETAPHMRPDGQGGQTMDFSLHPPIFQKEGGREIDLSRPPQEPFLPGELPHRVIDEERRNQAVPTDVPREALYLALQNARQRTLG